MGSGGLTQRTQALVSAFAARTNYPTPRCPSWHFFLEVKQCTFFTVQTAEWQISALVTEGISADEEGAWAAPEGGLASPQLPGTSVSARIPP